MSTGHRQLSGHLTPQIKSTTVIGRVEPSKTLTLTLGLGVKDPAGLETAVAQISDPRSPSYRTYVRPEEFADRYGAVSADYQKVLDWATSNNLTIATHRNRLAVEASGSVADIESALHVRMQYRLRPDGSQFYAPDVEPSVDVGVPLEHVSHMQNYAVSQRATGGGGSGPGGSRTGADFRHAYASCTPLEGAGQSIGIYMYADDGFLPIDVTNYFTYTSMNTFPSPLPVSVVGSPITAAGGEGDTDVQLPLSMAPGAQVIAFTGGTTSDPAPDTILNNMADSPWVKQLSSSYFLDGSGYDSIGLAAIAQFALQGQSFFQASGDSPGSPGCYWTTNTGDVRFPPALTIVGGTALNMTGSPPATVYDTEFPWYNSSTSGSFGGVECFQDGGGIGIPSYQVGLANSTNQASTAYRNFPDVAAEGANIAVFVNGSSSLSTWQGTSASAPGNAPLPVEFGIAATA